VSTDGNTLLSYLAISPQSPEESILRLLVEFGAQVVGASEGSLLVLDPARNELVFAITVGDSEKSLVGTRVPMGQGLTGLAALTQEVQIGAPTFKLATLEKQTKAGQPRSVMAAPMLAGGTLVGVITAVRFEGATFGSKDAQLYGRLASVAGLVVHQHQRLKAAESVAGGGGAEREAVATVARLARANPGAMEHVARLLLEVEALCRRERG
jgi:GAF domain-containing protein